MSRARRLSRSSCCRSSPRSITSGSSSNGRSADGRAGPSAPCDPALVVDRRAADAADAAAPLRRRPRGVHRDPAPHARAVVVRRRMVLAEPHPDPVVPALVGGGAREPPRHERDVPVVHHRAGRHVAHRARRDPGGLRIRPAGRPVPTHAASAVPHPERVPKDRALRVARRPLLPDRSHRHVLGHRLPAHDRHDGLHDVDHDGYFSLDRPAPRGGGARRGRLAPPRFLLGRAATRDARDHRRFALQLPRLGRRGAGHVDRRHAALHHDAGASLHAYLELSAARRRRIQRASRAPLVAPPHRRAALSPQRVRRRGTRTRLAMAEVDLRGVSKGYKDTTAVDDLSLHIKDREFVALLGPSGCGKTTTLRMLAGFIRPDSGQILIDGKDVTNVPPERRPTAMVFQSYALWPHMTVADNIAFGLRLRRLPKTEVEDRTGRMLEVVGLPGVMKRYPSQLSGGQQQRVALARALVLGPKILLLDEPLSNLDAKLRVRMRDEIRRIQQELQITTVYVTHDQEEALTMADRIAVMNKGVLQQVGDALDIYDRPATAFVADFIGSSHLPSGTLRLAGPVAVAQVGEARVPVEADGLPDGAAVTVSARPEDMEVLRAPAPDAFRLEDPRLVNFGAYKRLLGRHPAFGQLEARVPKAFALGKEPVYLRFTRARAFTSDEGDRS